jgi:hypothetical protein
MVHFAQVNYLGKLIRLKNPVNKNQRQRQMRTQVDTTLRKNQKQTINKNQVKDPPMQSKEDS